MSFTIVPSRLFILVIAAVMSAPATLQAVVVPPGLNPGDVYHLAFTTQDSIDGTSADVNVYNSFAQAQAVLANPATGTAAGVVWKALASTPTMNAIDNVPISGPIFLLDGVTKIADNQADLWDGSIDAPIDLDQFLATPADTGFNSVYTGTTTSGVASAFPFSTFDDVTVGQWDWSNNQWVESFVWGPYTIGHPIYAISGPIPVGAAIPEPSTALLLGIGLIGLTTRRGRSCLMPTRMKRKSARMQTGRQIIFSVVLLALLVGGAQGATLYGVVGDGGAGGEGPGDEGPGGGGTDIVASGASFAAANDLLILNQNSGAVTSVVLGLGNGNDGEALAYHPNNGLMYHWSGLGDPNVDEIVETINLKTLAITGVTLSGTDYGEIYAATADPSGGFLVTDAGRDLYHVTEGGFVTLRGTLDAQAKGLAFLGGTLYGIEHKDTLIDNDSTDLFTIDVSDGSTLSSFDLGIGNGRSNGLALHPDTGQLWAVVQELGNNRSLVVINLDLENTTLIGPLEDGVASIAFVPSAVPEPSTAALLLLGSSWLLMRRR